MRIFVDGIEYIPNGNEQKAVAVSMWYDRHRREWVIYTIDTEGNQFSEARYGFSKAEAMSIKKEMEEELWQQKHS